ncbi:MAG: hypothetical protein QNJ45_04795 [Ardenticatenaceae bacterium]|nr:hypothetical protein [Ardenticatenaceae bacterium]
MGLIQKLVTNFLPRSLSQAIEAESRSWILRCQRCDESRSVWDAGGVRYKATSAKKITAGYCSNCQKMSRFSLERNQGD